MVLFCQFDDKKAILPFIIDASQNNHLALNFEEHRWIKDYGDVETLGKWASCSPVNDDVAGMMRGVWVFPRDARSFVEDSKFGANREYELDCHEIGINEKMEDFFLESACVVDLSQSDESIKKSFSVWLERKRAEQEIEKSKRISKAMIQRLHQQRILPYLDLYLYWLAEGKEMPTLIEIAEMLYPPDMVEWDKDYSEILRETIRPRAMMLLKNKVNLIF